MIFGMNLHALASTVIGQQHVTWRQFKSRTQNSRGQWITIYYPDVPIIGSWQPVDERTVKELGLDTSKNYHNLYTSNYVDNVQRGESPDLILNGLEIHEVVGKTDWYRQNGWRGIMCVYVR